MSLQGFVGMCTLGPCRHVYSCISGSKYTPDAYMDPSKISQFKLGLAEAAGIFRMLPPVLKGYDAKL